jgi:histone-lysine N-methyltransferase SUV420H
VYFWTTIRKNRGGRFSASRGLQQEDIAEVLRKTVIIDKDPAHAVRQLLQLPGLRKFVAGLKDEKEREHFTRHLARYVRIYMPDCPFEVTTTNRYTINEHEASVTAKREIKPREEIKYLTGVQVAMTEEQEKVLELARKDFSLVISSRKKTRSLFLGPARFANHDCDANARLSTKGYDGMQIVAVKHIEVGDEITVSYGEDYFGEDNEECLCHTCEDRMVNGWAPFKPAESDDENEDEDEDEKVDEAATPKQHEPSEEGGSSSSRRKRKLELETETPEESTPTAKRVKVEEQEPSQKPLPTSPTKRRVSQPLRETTLKKAYSSSALRQEVPVSSIEDPITNLAASPQVSRDIRTQQRVGLLNITLDETVSSRDSTPQSPMTAGSPKSFNSTDATSVDEDAPMPDADDKNGLNIKPTLGVATVRTETHTVTTIIPTIFDDDSCSDVSELSSSYELDDTLQEVVKRKRSKTPPATRATRSQSRYAGANRIGTPVQIDQTDAGMVENPRKPGDYVKSAALLSQKYNQWVECHTCDDPFVQADAYHVRKECPRCERHSKLFGFAWPKTDKEGKWDKEERVLDHRTVHRFVDPDEEKLIKRGRKLLKDSIVERFSTPRSESISTADPDSGRQRRRLRKTM